MNWKMNLLAFFGAAINDRNKIQDVKMLPEKNAGFIILLTSIFTLFFCGEIRNILLKTN